MWTKVRTRIRPHDSKNIYPAITGPRCAVGASAAGEIGLGILREKCPHFGQWLARLENLSHAQNQIDPFFQGCFAAFRPLADSTHQLSEISFLIARIVTEEGVTGDGYLLSFHYSPQAIAGALHDLRPLALGWEVSETGRFIHEAEKEQEYFGHAGLHRWALGILNVAMWDAWAKTLGQPVWRLFGVCHDKVPLYGSGGWISYTVEELLGEVKAYVKRGFRAVKVKVGSPELERDIERLTRVREAVGGRVNIMMDANQGMNVANALRLAERAAPAHHLV